MDATSPKAISEKYSAGPNFSAIAASGGPNSRDQKSRHRPGEERADRARRQRDSRPALLGHLIAVQSGNYRCCFAWEIDKYRSCRSAVLGTIINTRQHDQRRYRRQCKRDGQQHGDRGSRPETWQHADQRAEKDTDQTVKQVGEGKGSLKTESDIVDEVHKRLLSSDDSASTAAEPRPDKSAKAHPIP